MVTKTSSTRIEREHHKQAFETYYTLGPRRTYAAVAERFGVSMSTIKNWSRAFRWRRMLQVRQAWQTQQVTEHMDQVLQERTDRARKLLDLALARMARYLADGKLKTAPRDLLLLEGLKRRLSRLNDRASDPDQPVRRMVLAIMPHNGRSEPRQPLIPESQLDDYLASMRYEGPAKGGSSV